MSQDKLKQYAIRLLPIILAVVIIVIWASFHHQKTVIKTVRPTIVIPKISTSEAPIKSTNPTVGNMKVLQKLNLTSQQYHYLMLASKIGHPYNLSLTLMAIMWRETRAGKFGPVGNKAAPFGERAYGLMQVKLKTALRVIHQFPKKFAKYQSYTKDRILALLIYKPKFNIQIALGYCLILKSQGLSWEQMITAYNLGYEGASDIDPTSQAYTQDIIAYVRSGIVYKLSVGADQ